MSAAAERALPVVVLAGNPNVGKSTLFNRLTGMKQHTGNWPGKTVGSAWGRVRRDGWEFLLGDTPGTYSLLSHSPEEEAARDAICFGGADVVAVVCDATCLERGLELALQVMALTRRVVVCVNLMDEARRRGIKVDISALEAALGVPVVGCAARDGKGLEKLLQRARAVAEERERPAPREIRLAPDVEYARERIAAALRERGVSLDARYAALRVLEGDRGLWARLEEELGAPLAELREVREETARLAPERVREESAAALFDRAGQVFAACVRTRAGADRWQARLDRLLAGRYTALPLMLLLLALVLFLTIAGANAPSELLFSLFARAEAGLDGALSGWGAPAWLRGMLCAGMVRTLGWVVAVMLPPMAIFFPLFTLLEDAGYLPRVAFVLDRQFKRCRACGKQALTMCMGLGCNAAAVVGCRIIDSPRERRIAMLTNVFMPCNGRFPMMIALIGLFLAPAGLPAALALAGVIVLGAAATFAASRLLSSTLLRGLPSAFTLELPPFRRPQVGRVIVRSVVERTLRMLGRAAAVAAPAGLVIWLLANLPARGGTLLSACVAALEPLGRFLGMDGALMMAFILALPANELVLPLAMLAYASGGALLQPESTQALGALLRANGWTWLTALNAILFSLMHWPCSTTLITIARETRSARWTLAGALLPTLLGAAVCALTAGVARALGLAA